MLFRNARQAVSVTYTIAEMLAFRDTWTTGFEENLEEKLAPPPPPERVPSKPLAVGENAYRPTNTTEMDRSAQLVRLVQSTLNKLTAENFEVLIPALLQPSLFEPGVAKDAVDRIFDKSLEEPKYAYLYAALCERMAKYENEYLEASKMVRKSIVDKTQNVYEQQQQHLDGNDDDAREKLRKRKLANIRFVGHLFERGLLAARIIDFILQNAIAAPKLQETDLEVTITLVDQIGHLLKGDMVGRYFEFLAKKAASDSAVGNRVRFLVLNLIDLRARDWKRPQPAEDFVAPAPPAPAKATKTAGVVAAPGDVTASLERRPPIPPELSGEKAKLALRKLVEMTADTAADDLKALGTVLGDQNPSVNRAACVASAIERACTTSNDANRESLCVTFALGAIDRQELRAGQAWSVSGPISSDVLSDCPKYFERLAPMLLAGLKDRASYKAMAKDVLGTAAQELDAVYEEFEGGVEWDSAYIGAWTALFTASKAHAKTTSGVVPPLAEILDTLALLPPTGIVHRTMTDVVSSLCDSGLCTYDDLKVWHTRHANSQKLQFICSAMALLV